jgi:predicted dinucleotide-binding enzyme
VDVVILSMPPTGFDKIKRLVAALPEQTVVIDTSNYFRQRDGENPAIEAGQVESEWVREYFGRSITKAWNSIYSESFAHNGLPKGHPGRVAVPVAGDRDRDREVAMRLVDDTGFDGFDAGTLADSWRQQPASPVYCTDLTYEEMAAALAAAERERLPILVPLRRPSSLNAWAGGSYSTPRRW